MKFVLYLFLSLIYVFGMSIDGTAPPRPEMFPVGVCVWLVIGYVLILSCFIMSKTKLKRNIALTLAIALTVAVIAVFCGICILVEFLIS